MTTQHAAETIKYSHAVEGLPGAQGEEQMARHSLCYQEQPTGAL